MTAEMQSLLDAYDDSLHSFHQLASTLRDDQWTLPTDCPGWTVREQVAHVLALELQLGGSAVRSPWWSATTGPSRPTASVTTRR
jgi:uncharacterized protein (TIGR03083 family)